MSSTRELVLIHLLNRQRCTINDLAEAVKINPISVRHHITKLEADGLVTSEEERHGVGRPRRVYFLTDKGMELFPSRYLSLSRRMLDMLKENLPKKTVEKLFQEMGSGIVQSEFSEVDFEEMNLEERVEMVRIFLVSEGFVVEVTKQDEIFHIRETSCPYVHVGKDHPEVCLVDETMIATMLATPVEKTHCVLSGDDYCSYTASIISDSDIK
ncbi:helix-turn-helix transcriptional regulator [Chloroflexota bacterium]